MKLGLIARCEIARGISLQSHNFYTHMPVDRVLLVRMPRPQTAENPGWYKNRTEVAYDDRTHRLPEDVVRGWLDGLDAVFCVETPHDWRIPLWCKQAGVKLIVQGNPEFVRHGLPGFEDMAHPDRWWWPTRWRMDHLPKGDWMPVPMDRRPAQPPPDDGRLHVLHVMGMGAFADRNGTLLLSEATRLIQGKVTVHVHGAEGALPEFRRSRDVQVVLEPKAVEDRWKMYDGKHLLVLPRRYAGLCLPAIEAHAAGLAVMMPDCSPNTELADFLMPVTRLRTINLACGPVHAAEVSSPSIAAEISALATKIDKVNEIRRESKLLHTWDAWQPKYMKALEGLL